MLTDSCSNNLEKTFGTRFPLQSAWAFSKPMRPCCTLWCRIRIQFDRECIPIGWSDTWDTDRAIMPLGKLRRQTVLPSANWFLPITTKSMAVEYKQITLIKILILVPYHPSSEVFEILRKPFVQPSVVPPRTSDQVTNPLVSEFVLHESRRNHYVFRSFVHQKIFFAAKMYVDS